MAKGVTKVGLLGTRFTMEQPFYADRLRNQHGLEVITPKLADREIVHRIIYSELCLGKVMDESREAYRNIIVRLIDQGSEAIILGCTEISLLVGRSDSAVPLFDTTGIHAMEAADRLLAG